MKRAARTKRTMMMLPVACEKDSRHRRCAGACAWGSRAEEENRRVSKDRRHIDELVVDWLTGGDASCPTWW